MHSQRLLFLDALRAFAILMMLQGHFVHALLDTSTVDTDGFIYSMWEYFRGNTAPVFFTITGIVFTFLLVKSKSHGWENTRVKKGFRRGLKLIFWGYLLQLNLMLLLHGELGTSLFYSNVLQTIGLSLILLIGLYLLFQRFGSRVLRYVLLGVGCLLFAIEPWYAQFTFEGVPPILANVMTKAHGSIFTIFPWFGYVAIGGYVGCLLHRYHHEANFYRYFITTLAGAGLLLMFLSSAFFMSLYELTDFIVFKQVAYNNYLFIRLGNVLLTLAVFVGLRQLISHKHFLEVGTRTLSIYIVHFVVLYGTWFGLGLNRWLAHSLSGWQAALGALLFMSVVCVLVLTYYRHEELLRTQTELAFTSLKKAVKRLPAKMTAIRLALRKK